MALRAARPDDTTADPADSQSLLTQPTGRSRRRFLQGAALSLGGLAAGVAAGRTANYGPEVQGDASPRQQERRGDAFHGDLGIWPIIWSVPVSSNAIALTFDDGPDPAFTPRILDILARYRAPATFNMMGWNCVQHPGIVAAVVAAGHEIGNHTWSHLDLAKVDPPTARSELRRGRDVIEKVSGRDLTFFRPPRGELSGAALRYAAEHQQSILMWTINGGVQTLGSPEVVRDALVPHVQPGYIIGMHDGIGRGTFDRSAPFARTLAAHRSVEVDALPGVIESLQARNLRFVTISQLLTEPRIPGRLTVSGAPEPASLEGSHDDDEA